MNKIFEMFQEDNGGISNTRVVTLIFCACMVTEWIHAIFTTGVFSPNMTSVSIVLGCIGLKVAQKPFEQKVGEAGK